MPAGSSWAPTRAELWNAVEAKNKRADAQVARELVIALPAELDAPPRLELAIAFTREIADRYSVAADVAVHLPSREGDSRNHHVHILMSTNRVDGFGFGNKVRELDLVAHNMSGKLGQANEIDWLRERWAVMANAALAQQEQATRIDHGSYADLALAAGHDVGLANISTLHLGPRASALERRGVRTVPGNLNREIQVVNLELERARRAMRTDAEEPPALALVPAPAPAAFCEEDTAQRRDRLQRELRVALGLPTLPTPSETLQAIRRRRDDLPAISDRRLRESVALQAAAQRLEEAKSAFRKLNERRDDLQARSNTILTQAGQHTAATKWREQHPLLAWLHDRGLFKCQAADGVLAAPDQLQSHWVKAKEDWTLIEAELVVAQEVQQDALRTRVQVQEQVKQEVRQETQDVTRKLDRAEVLANDLLKLENMERRMREVGPRQQLEAATPESDVPRPIPELPTSGPSP